ncbi:DNA mismatch endonuclease Vsr [Corallococcus sp. AB032C]|uniref:very short patch repair endonuclease n=1 Tax=Corallococcus TaxID=83461 RepID=UPI000EE68B06|nr:DNA mismatch endonuclease Vsr [Corallococcus exiguus]RKH77684.1 DNA mismatch endonuclease Vsr [Corallococcus sp. AB032C]
MADILTPEQRSYCMSRIQGKDTKPELTVRKIARALGFRYRLHAKSLPGTPDLVFSSRRKVIFVHGCFWHRHSCRYGQVEPKTRREFWLNKLQGNVARDRRNIRNLHRLDWRVLTIWECQTRNPIVLARRLKRFIDAD